MQPEDNSTQSLTPQNNIPTSQLTVQPKKSSSISILVTLFVIVLLGLVAYFFNQNQQLKSQLSQPSYVTSSPETTMIEDEATANWKTYTSKAGYLIKYPQDLLIDERVPGFIVFLEDISNTSSQWFYIDERGVSTISERKRTKQNELISPQFDTIPFITSEHFVVTGTIKSGMGQGSLIKNAYINLKGQELIIGCDINQQCHSLLPQILSTFKFTDGDSTNTSTSSKTLRYLTLSATVPSNWKITEKNVRPAEANSNMEGKTCADYDITSSDQTATLTIASICEFADGGSSPLPSDSVTVKNNPTGSIVRYFNQGKYIYSTAFLTGDPVHSYPPIVSFKLLENNLLFTRISFVSTDTLNLQDQLNTADSIVASIK